MTNTKYLSSYTRTHLRLLSPLSLKDLHRLYRMVDTSRRKAQNMVNYCRQEQRHNEQAMWNCRRVMRDRQMWAIKEVIELKQQPDIDDVELPKPVVYLVYFGNERSAEDAVVGTWTTLSKAQKAGERLWFRDDKKAIWKNVGSTFYKHTTWQLFYSGDYVDDESTPIFITPVELL